MSRVEELIKELAQLQKKEEELLVEEREEPGKHALGLNALGMEISYVGQELNEELAKKENPI